jgi:leader peptidase (prepilin peptidase) / N-methyltransferase
MENLPLIAVLLLLILGVPLAITDIKEHRLPNPITYFAIAVSVVLVIAAGLWTSRWLDLLAALVVGGITLGIGYLMARFNGIGMGDVKYLVATNTLLGWFSPWLILPMLAIGFTLASLVSLGLIISRRANLKTPIAMGPFLMLGFLVVSLPLFERVVTVAGGS